jgi:hypothetical protein
MKQCEQKTQAMQLKWKLQNLVSTKNNVMDFYILEHCDNDHH